jgi:hypothetical protein
LGAEDIGNKDIAEIIRSGQIGNRRVGHEELGFSHYSPWRFSTESVLKPACVAAFFCALHAWD